MLAGVLLLLSACMDSQLVTNQEDEENTEAMASRTVIEFWHTYSDLETEVFENKVLPAFEKQYPDIDIRAERKDYTEQLKNNTLAAAAENEQPDLMRMDIVWVPEFAQSRVLTDLSSLPGFDELEKQFIGKLLETAKFQDGIYGLPVNANTKAAIFNQQLLKKAGLSEPPKTMEKLVQAVRKLKQMDEDTYGIGMCCSSGWGTLPYFWTLGGKITDEHYTTAHGYLDSPGSIEALQTIKQWYDEGIISPAILGGEPGNWDGLLKGTVLMIDEAHWFYTVNSSGTNQHLLEGTLPALMPAGTRKGTSIIGGENLVLFKDSPHQEEAWTFMKWMVSEEPQKMMSETGLIPTITGLTGHTLDPRFDIYLQQLDQARPRPPTPHWSFIDDVFARMIEKILSNEMALKESVEEAVKRIDSVLQQ